MCSPLPSTLATWSAAATALSISGSSPVARRRRRSPYSGRRSQTRHRSSRSVTGSTHLRAQAPLSSLFAPDVRTAVTVDDLAECILGETCIGEEISEVLGREFAVVTTHERHALFAREMAVADLMRGVRC